MKVAIYIYSLRGGGAERVTALLANRWAADGIEVSIITVCPVEIGEYALDASIKRVSLHLVRTSTNPIKKMWSNFKEIFALRRILKKERPDVAIGMMVSSSIILALAAFGTRTMPIGSERLYPLLSAPNRTWLVLRCVLYRFLFTIVCQTSDGAQWIKTHTWARRADVIPNPICLPIPRLRGEIAPSDVVGSDPNQKMLLCAGRLVKQKRFDLAIAAFAVLAERHPNWNLVVLGEGPERLNLSKLGRSLRLDGRLYMPGAVGNIGDWYEACDLFALTSDHEGFPNVLLEAMAHGRASVAYDCKTGPRDLIDNDQNGLLIAVGRNDHFVAGLDRCMSDPDLRLRLGSSAKLSSEVYSIERVSELWKELFLHQRPDEKACKCP